MKETAFIYTRVSTDKQDTMRQINDLKEFAERNQLNIVHIYSDTISGTKSRKERAYMLDEVRKHKAKYFLIADISRFGRNVKAALDMKDELHKIGVCLWSMETNLKSLNEDGEVNAIANLVFTQLLSVYEMENATKRAAIKSGLKTAVSKGKILGRPMGATIDRLKKYLPVVKLIKEEERKRLRGERYLSVRKTAAYVKLPTSTIINIRKDMKEADEMPTLGV
jgi:DNA invertase Pin-like site-specific DNA recombinase